MAMRESAFAKLGRLIVVKIEVGSKLQSPFSNSPYLHFKRLNTKPHTPSLLNALFMILPSYGVIGSL
jgi:hypothetical protein